MRVLHASPYFAPAFVYGGPPRNVLGLCRALRAQGADVSVVTTTANGQGELPTDVAGEARYEDVPVSYLPRSFPKRAFRAAALGPLLTDRLRSVDLVHIHGCWNAFGWTAAAYCRSAAIPYVLSPRGMLYPWSFRQGRLRKFASYYAFEARTLRAAAFVHATSAEEAGVLADLGVTRPVVTIPNGVTDASADVRGRAGEFRRRYGIPGDAFVILFLGRLHPEKGIELLLDAFRTAAAAHSAAVLLVAGTGEQMYADRLHQRVADLVGAKRIVFTGHLAGDDRALALAGADAFALTSFAENFGVAVAEAMAAGLPVIVTRSCPWPMIIEWRAGWWVEPTSDAVAEALFELLACPAAARAMGERGRRAALAAFDWSRIGQRMLAAYQSVLK